MDCYYCHYTADKSGLRGDPSHAGLHELPRTREANQPPAFKGSRELRDRRTGAMGPHSQLADFVFFNHQAHVTAGVSCVSCHGRIDQMVEVKQVKPLNMAWCLECHRNPAPNIRPVDQVTNLGWQPDRDPAEIGHEIIQAKGINPPQNCSGCHR